MESEIQKFYKGTKLFITGGTGFMGKLLLEKLLRSTDVDSIYVLIREKKGKSMYTRLDELFEDVVFDRLKKECPKFRHKISPISGDCSMSGLGLSMDDRQTLISNINIIFHVAATVRFDENVKFAYDINVNATKEILEISKQMKNIKSIIHVSTAYSNCNQKTIEEKFYEGPNYEEVGLMLEKLSKKEADELTPRIIGNWPNTYSFTKALAESLIKDTSDGLPIGIFRPAIVLSTNSEPVEGWLDNMYGPTGITAAGSSGLLRVLQCDNKLTTELVPADTCTAGIIASAWEVGTQTCERVSSNIKIYNYVTSVENPLTWDEYGYINTYFSAIYPLSHKYWATNVICTTNRYVYVFLTYMLHLFPALLADTVTVLMGKTPRLLKLYKKMHKLMDLLVFFSTNEWTFTNQNTQDLYKKLSDPDKEIFKMSVANINWFKYYKNYMRGIRMYLLKDPLDNLEAARVKHRRFDIVSTSLNYILTGALAIGLWTIVCR